MCRNEKESDSGAEVVKVVGIVVVGAGTAFVDST